MSTPTVDPPLAVAFRAFLHEVLVCERRILERRDPPSADGAAALREHLASLLRRQETDALAEGRDPETPAFQQGRHLMATVADATFVDLDWWGRRAWHQHPLADDFQPEGAVQLDIFERVDSLLEADFPDLELVQVFLLVLVSGRLPETRREAARAAACQLRLRLLLAGRLPDLGHDDGEHLFPDAYPRKIERSQVTYLPRVKSWLLAFVVVASLILIASFTVWRQATAVARGLVEQIFQALG